MTTATATYRQAPAFKDTCPTCEIPYLRSGTDARIPGPRKCPECRRLEKMEGGNLEHFRTINQLARSAPTGPTSAPPGSAERIAVMCARVAAGLPVCHPWDWNERADLN